MALKFLSPDLAVDPTYRERFLREARVAERLKHEHIVEVSDWGQTSDGMVYIVMEYLRGRPLNEEIFDGPMSPRRALTIALQIAQALGRAHELGVVHRDIKPDNIYLLDGYQGDHVKLLDFGLAKMRGEISLTATGAVFGTPEYMAPEQARGAPTTGSVDIYALGCVLFEMLTSKLPFEGAPHELMMKHIRHPPPDVTSFRPAVPTDVGAFVRRLMSKPAEDRPPDAYVLSEELLKLVARLGGAERAVPTAANETDQGALVQTSIEDAWGHRARVFRRLLDRAHPQGDAPEWLPGAISGLEERVVKMAELREELSSLANVRGKKEEETSAVQRRIGRALDELARDESRVRERSVEVSTRLQESEARLRELGRPLRRVWGDAGPCPKDGDFDAGRLENLREAGQLASVWLEAEREKSRLEREVSTLGRELEDLTFQMHQLKGRLGSLEAVDDMERTGVHEESYAIEENVRTLMDEVMRGASPIYKHFLRFPELAEELRSPPRRIAD